MPSQWQSIAFKDIFLRIQSGYWGEEHPTKERPNMVRVIRNADVTRDGKRKSFAVRAFSDRERDKAALFVGDIVLATSGEVGKAWLVDEDGYHVTNFLKRLTVNPSVAEPGFARHLFDWEPLKRDMAAHTGGSAIQNLRRSFFESVWVPLPPLAEQRRVVDLVGSIDSYIDSLQTQVEATRTARSALLAEVLAKPGNHWHESTLGDAAVVEMGQSPPGDTYNSGGDGLPFLQGSAEFGERFPSPNRWCSAPNRVAEPGDLLVSVRAPVGDTNFADTRLAIGRGLARVQGSSVASAEFLRLVIQAEVGRLNRNAGGGMFASITAKNLRGFRVVLPPLQEQHQIVNLIGSIDEQVALLEAQVNSAQLFRRSAISELLSGERLLDESYDVAVSL